jgi:hypothetical protein
MIFPLL